MKKKILLVLIIIVILVGAGFAYAYYATDAFKTEKEMFFSYILTDDVWTNFKNEELTEFMKKQQTTPFTIKGEIGANVSGNGMMTEGQSLEMLNKSKITFDGKSDVNKKLTEQVITLNMGQAFNIPINFRIDGETVGIQSGFLNSKFIAVRNNNLKGLFKKFGIEGEEIPDKLEVSQEEFTEDEVKILKDKYFAILNDNLEEKSFSKEKINNQTILTLRISEEKFVDILLKILETAYNDELLLSKTIEKEELKEQIEELMNMIKEAEISDTSIFEIKLYVENKDVKKYEIQVPIIEDNESIINIVIENTDTQVNIKISEDGELFGEIGIYKESNETYNMIVKLYNEDDINLQIDFNMQYLNLLELNNVEEKYEMKITLENTDKNSQFYQDTTEITVNYKDLITFNENLEIEGLNNQNSIVLNDATEQELQNLMISIYQNLGLM